MSMSFTMNWKMTAAQHAGPVRGGRAAVPGDPADRATSVPTWRGRSVTYQKLADDPEVARSYQEWHDGRRQFHEQKARGRGQAGRLAEGLLPGPRRLRPRDGARTHDARAAAEDHLCAEEGRAERTIVVASPRATPTWDVPAPASIAPHSASVLYWPSCNSRSLLRVSSSISPVADRPIFV